ncbi:MAG: zur 1 [Firmicutes bacterium]|nr:zur 1 [Bacillota bacterium]
MKDIIELLRSRGYKMTPQRRTVIKALFECGKFPTAQDILEYAKTINPDMGLDTIYRNLNLLTEIGVLNIINIKSRDVSVFEVVTNHHHHLICLDCGQMECLDYCPIAGDSEKMAEEKEFKIVGHSLEFYGYCCKCQAS